MAKTIKSENVRRFVQIAFFVLIAAIAVNHTLEESGNALPVLGSASLHALCPFGGVVSIYQYATTGTYTQKIHESAFVLMFIGFAIAILAGPVFCGWVCPLGTFQEWIGKIGKKLFGKKYNRFLPAGVDRYLRYLRYAVLAWVIYMTARSGALIFQDWDPYFTLFNFWTGEIAITGYIALGVVIVASLFVERPFCKYACPYGAVLGVFNTFRLFGLKRNATTCIDCRACDRTCPMNITVSTGKTIRDHQCISCLKCTSEAACPVPETLSLMVGSYNSSETPVEATK